MGADTFYICKAFNTGSFEISLTRQDWVALSLALVYSFCYDVKSYHYCHHFEQIIATEQSLSWFVYVWFLLMILSTISRCFKDEFFGHFSARQGWFSEQEQFVWSIILFVPSTKTFDSLVDASSFSVSTRTDPESSMIGSKQLMAWIERFGFSLTERGELIKSLSFSRRFTFWTGFNSVIKLPRLRLLSAFGLL